MSTEKIFVFYRYIGEICLSLTETDFDCGTSNRAGVPKNWNWTRAWMPWPEGKLACREGGREMNATVQSKGS